MRSVSKAALLTGTASAAFVAGFPATVTPAHAQSALPTVPIGTYNWTGFYVGVQGGGIWSDEEINALGDCGPFSNLISGGEVIADDVADIGCFAGDPIEGPNADAGTFPTFLLGEGIDSEDDDYVAWTGSSHDGSKLLGQAGTHFGYNTQAGPVVFGVEVDTSGVFGDGPRQGITFDYFDNEENDSPDLFDYFGTGTVTSETNLRWLTTIRGRAGAAIGPDGRIFLFATGGLAIGNFDNRIKGAFDPGGETFCSDCTFGSERTGNETRLGLALGAGGEFGLTPNMRFGFQYLFTRFRPESSNSITFVGDDGHQFDVNLGGGPIIYHTFTARVTWAFGAP